MSNGKGGFGRLCSAHYMQKHRTGKITSIVEGPPSERLVQGVRARLIEAAFALADADSEDDLAFERLRAEFWAAFRAAARVGADVVALSNPEGTLRRR